MSRRHLLNLNQRPCQSLFLRQIMRAHRYRARKLLRLQRLHPMHEICIIKIAVEPITRVGIIVVLKASNAAGTKQLAGTTSAPQNAREKLRQPKCGLHIGSFLLSFLSF